MGPGIRRYLVAVLGLFIVVALWRGWGPGSLSQPIYYTDPNAADGQQQPADANQQAQPGDAQNPLDGQPQQANPGAFANPIQPDVVLDTDDTFFWRQIKEQYPVSQFRPLPASTGKRLPPVQASFGPESEAERNTRTSRQQTIKDAFFRCWRAYRDHAWMRDELLPVTGKSRDTFGGWGATLIDSLDTLWLMDLRNEFEESVDALSRRINFDKTQAEEINVFETTIRHLGGLLSAFDLSGDMRLLNKAKDVGDMLYKSFDTPNHLPATRWNLQAAAEGENQTALSSTLVAELGSLSMEFTRLSIITKDPKFFDAVQHISDLFADAQMDTKLPGMWPVLINAADSEFDAGSDYSIGGMADSMYEYLPKMAALLGDGDGVYRDMYLRAMDAVHSNLLFRPMLPAADEVLFAGSMHVDGVDGRHVKTLQTSTGHLSCFAGGMFALGSRLFANQTHQDLGDLLTRGCLWAYNATTTRVMPESFHLVACPDLSACDWDQKRWYDGIREKQSVEKQSGDKSLQTEQGVKEAVEKQFLPKGITKITDPKYTLRPEAVESLFVMYRVTGHPYWRDAAWDMWQSIEALTRTKMANSAVEDVNHDPDEEAEMSDAMESFWLGETLKYFYLIFSEPDLVNLDEWVFNTEAHPFRRMG